MIDDKVRARTPIGTNVNKGVEIVSKSTGIGSGEPRWRYNENSAPFIRPTMMIRIRKSLLDYHSVSETTGSTIACGEWGSPQFVGLNANNIVPMILNHITVGSLYMRTTALIMTK